MFSRLLLKSSADETCMEAIDQVVVRPLVKGAKDAAQVRWGSDTAVRLEPGSDRTIQLLHAVYCPGL